MADTRESSVCYCKRKQLRSEVQLYLCSQRNRCACQTIHIRITNFAEKYLGVGALNQLQAKNGEDSVA